MLKTAVKNNVYTCKYCNKNFKREKTLFVHMCEKKRRWNNQNDSDVRVGFGAFNKFFEYTQRTTKLKPMMDFIKSPYYIAFVKFGRYCIDIKAINPSRFVEFVIKKNKKLDYWTSDKLYTEYLSELLVTENSVDALTRAIEFSIKWANKNNVDSKDILRHGNPNEICYAIVNGKLSSWVLFNCTSGIKFLEVISSEQTEIIWDFINPEIWKDKFDKYPDETSYVKEMLTNLGW